MKYYLSSYRIGDETQTLQELLQGKTVGYIPNAGDFSDVDPVLYTEITARDTKDLEDLGINVELLDLKKYFNNKDVLEEKLETLDGIWIRGGNVFVLRQAMKLSGLDELLINNCVQRDDFVYAGYSAAGCVLSPSFECYKIVDVPEAPYEQWKEVIWEGLGLIDVAFMPHFDSDHGESADIDKEIQLCKESNMPYKALRDGEVWIFSQ